MTPQQSNLALHFKPASSAAPALVPRLAISLEALDKRGKTYYALNTTPEPVAVFTNDPGTVPTLRDALAMGRKIPWIFEQEFEKPDPKVIKAENVNKDEARIWTAEWKRFEAAANASSDKPPTRCSMTRQSERW